MRLTGWQLAVYEALHDLSGPGHISVSRHELLQFRLFSLMERAGSGTREPGQAVSLALQRLRDKGLVEFVGIGMYRLREPVEGSTPMADMFKPDESETRQRIETDAEGFVLRTEREVLPPRARDLPPPTPLVLRAPVAAEPMQREGLPGLAWEVVTPAVADDWLAHNTGNRPLKASRVTYYARLMREGHWRDDNPEPIAFDWDDALRNGQHRLAAVKQSKQSVGFLVCRGIDPALGDVMDTPAVRTAGDRLALSRGVAPGRGARYAAAIRGLVAWKDFPDRGPFERQTTARSNAEMVALLPVFVDRLEEYLPLTSQITHAGVRGGDSLWLTILCRFNDIDPGAAAYFGEHLATGEDLSRGNPILTLRNALLKTAVDPVTRPGSGLGRLVTARFAVQAWNAWREGRSLVALQQTGGEFPKIEGQRGYGTDAAHRRSLAQSRGQSLQTWPGAHTVAGQEPVHTEAGVYSQNDEHLA